MANQDNEMISYAGKYHIVTRPGHWSDNPNRDELGRAVMADPDTGLQSPVSFLVSLGDKRQAHHHHEEEMVRVVIRRLETRAGTKVWFKGCLPMEEYIPGQGAFPLTPYHDKTYVVTGTYDIASLEGEMMFKVKETGVEPLTYRADDGHHPVVRIRPAALGLFVPSI